LWTGDQQLDTTPSLVET